MKPKPINNFYASISNNLNYPIMLSVPWSTYRLGSRSIEVSEGRCPKQHFGLSVLHLVMKWAGWGLIFFSLRQFPFPLGALLPLVAYKKGFSSSFRVGRKEEEIPKTGSPSRSAASSWIPSLCLF